MPENETFLLDTNVFIEPKNRYYPFDICPGYWQLLEGSLGGDTVESLTYVYDEIMAGEDDLTDWTKRSFKRGQFIDCATDADVFAKYLEISGYVNALPDKRPNAIQDFLQTDATDPWLVAQAAFHGETVVTMEHSMQESKKKVSFIDVCDYFGVKHIEIFPFLRCLKAKFVLSS